MSYTQKKVSWEQCYRGAEQTSPYLRDSINRFIVGAEGARITLKTNDTIEYQINEYGDVVVENEYGDVSRKSPVQVWVRKQPHEDVITTAEGKTILTKSIFYVDPTIEPNALNIRYMDKLDGETVFQKYVMCTRSNKPRMVRFITV